MSFSNAVWGGWKMLNHHTYEDNMHKAEIELINDFTINQFIKGIIEHVEIIEIIKKSPSMHDVFIKATTNE
jgi:hypothetical protein